MKCPIHGIPDCSPLLNGCSYPKDFEDGAKACYEDARINKASVYRAVAKPKAYIAGYVTMLNVLDKYRG